MSDDIVARLRYYTQVDTATPVFIDNADLLKAADEIERLRAERDEARREVLRNEANHLPTMSDPYREAKRRGWDCLEPRRPWDCHRDYK